MQIKTSVIVLTTLLASCATRYEAPPESARTASVFVIGNGSQVKGGRNDIAVNIVAPSSCKILKHIDPVAAGETRELKLPVETPVTIMFSYFAIRQEFQLGKGPIAHCQDGFTLTPIEGKEYRVGLESSALRNVKCNNEVMERLVGQSVWKNAERERVCAD